MHVLQYSSYTGEKKKKPCTQNIVFICEGKKCKAHKVAESAKEQKVLCTTAPSLYFSVKAWLWKKIELKCCILSMWNKVTSKVINYIKGTKLDILENEGNIWPSLWHHSTHIYVWTSALLAAILNPELFKFKVMQNCKICTTLDLAWSKCLDGISLLLIGITRNSC